MINLIATIWESLEWNKTLQLAFITLITGISAALPLLALALLAHPPATTLIAGGGMAAASYTAAKHAHARR